MIPLVGSTPIYFTEPKATFVFSYEAVTYIMPDEFDFRSRASSTNPYQEKIFSRHRVTLQAES